MDTLSDLSGLPVHAHSRNGVNYFVFGPEEQAVKSVCTYRKAKIFAQGVALGRELGK
jgi:hypothetical protein